MRFLMRLLLVAGGLGGIFAVTLAAGLRQGLLALLGIDSETEDRKSVV